MATEDEISTQSEIQADAEDSSEPTILSPPKRRVRPNKNHHDSITVKGLSPVPVPLHVDNNCKTSINMKYERPRYLSWLGRNVFFCGGRLMLGIHWKQALLSLMMIWGTYAFFFSVVVPWLISKWWNDIGLCLLLSSSFNLLVTSGMDPGIIPRCAQSPLIDLMPDAVKTQINYCSSCHIVRPARAKHCRHCDNCIRSFDHHCPWTGNCIGARNYRVFIMFLITTTAMSYLVFLGTFLFLWNLGATSPNDTTNILSEQGQTSVVGASMSLLLFVWSLLSSLYLSSLTSFHFMIMCLGKTTNEYLKAPNDAAYTCAPITLLNNCSAVCCQEIPPSALLPMHELPTDEEMELQAAASSEALSALRDALSSPDPALERMSTSLERSVSSERQNSRSSERSQSIERTNSASSLRGSAGAGGPFPHYYQLGGSLPQNSDRDSDVGDIE